MNDHTVHKNFNKSVAGEQVTDKEVKKGKDNELIACQQELKALQEKYVRVSADLQNFQSRIAKERALWAQEAQTELILGFLCVLDNFDRALAEHQKEKHDEKFAAWLEGFELIGKNLYKFLHDKGIREIDASTTFDPQYHEAIAHIADPNKKLNEIVEVAQKGYLFNDVVIRPAKVVVAK